MTGGTPILGNFHIVGFMRGVLWFPADSPLDSVSMLIWFGDGSKVGAGTKPEMLAMFCLYHPFLGPDSATEIHGGVGEATGGYVHSPPKIQLELLIPKSLQRRLTQLVDATGNVTVSERPHRWFAGIPSNKLRQSDRANFKKRPFGVGQVSIIHKQFHMNVNKTILSILYKCMWTVILYRRCAFIGYPPQQGCGMRWFTG